MTLLCIDPGVTDLATALFDCAILNQVGFWPARVPSEFRAYDRAIVEIPQFDSRVAIHTISLAVAGAYLAGSVAERAVFVTPTEWKGSTPKPIHHAKIWAELSDAERDCFPICTAERIERARERGAKDAWRKDGAYYYGKGKGYEVHNLLDAAGLGLWHTGRLKKGK